MGMFDTINIEKSYNCSHCGSEIRSVQTKEFGNTLSDYHAKDCVSHAEDVRIVKEQLFCDKCHEFIDEYVYLVVARGILIGVTDSLKDAQAMLNGINLEKMILWYHDLYEKYRVELREKQKSLGFMRQVIEWFEKGYHKIKEERVEERRQLAFFAWTSEYLKETQEPLEALKKYLDANMGKKEEPSS